MPRQAATTGQAIAHAQRPHRRSTPSALSQAEETLALHIRVESLPAPEREYRFAPPRKWRIDFAWPEAMLAVEVEGLTHGGGRHQTMDGYSRDCEKYNAAVLAGWRVLRFTQRQVYSLDAVSVIQRALAAKVVMSSNGRSR